MMALVKNAGTGVKDAENKAAASVAATDNEDDSYS